MKNKILLLCLMMFSIFFLTGCQTEEISLSVELAAHNASLASSIEETKKMISTANITINAYSNESVSFPYFSQNVTNTLELDNEVGYLSIYSMIDDQIQRKEIYQSIEGKTLHLFTESKILRTEVLQDKEDFMTYLNDTGDTEKTYFLLDYYDTITKDEVTGLYSICILTNNLSSSDKDILNQVFGSDTVDDFVADEAEITFSYLYNEDDTELTQTIDIGRYYDSTLENYIELTMEIIVSATNNINPQAIDPDEYTTEGAPSIDEALLTLTPDRNKSIYVDNEVNNYFAFYLEEGFYVIDNQYRQFNDVDIEVYDHLGNPIEGTNVYQINEPGLYYVNFIQKTALNIRESISVYKVSEEYVGTPSNPIYQTTGTVTLEDTEEPQAFMLFESAPSDGVLVIESPSENNSSFLSFSIAMQYSYLLGDTYFSDNLYQYHIISVQEGETVILESTSEIRSSFEINWYFLGQVPFTSDISSMPEISLTDPTFILLTNDESEVRYKINITEVGSYSFLQTLIRNEAMNATYTIKLYDSENQLVSSDLLNEEVSLQVGTYYLKITNIDNIQSYPLQEEFNEYNYILFALYSWKN